MLTLSLFFKYATDPCWIWYDLFGDPNNKDSISERYGTSDSLQWFQDNLIDLRRIIEKFSIFPLYFYYIKDIAKLKFLNLEWRHEKTGGGQSVFWYAQWLETGDSEILSDIINYNEDDVRATEYLFDWIKNRIPQENILK